jgi:hypothetical protein
MEKEFTSPEWDYARGDWYWDVSCGYTQHLLTWGLEKLHRLAVADTYDAKRNLVYPDMHEYNDRFLFDALYATNDQPEDEDYQLRYYSSSEVIKALGKEYFHDPDEGPIKIWIASHSRATSDDFINGFGKYSDLRMWGYVMWDEARLRTLQTGYEHMFQ